MNERTLITETTEKLFQRLVTPDMIKASEEGEWNRDLWQALLETGLTKVGINEEAGGFGGGMQALFSVVRLAGKYAVPLPIVETLLANHLLATAHLRVTEGPATVCVAEGQATLEKKNGQWHVSGTLSPLPWARHAQTLVLIATADKEQYIAQVEREQAQIQNSVNYAGEPRDTVILEQVSIPERAFVKVPFPSQRMRYAAALFRAVQMTGALEQAFKLTVNYSQERKQFGRPISRFQAIQHHVATLAGEVIAAKTSVEKAQIAYENGDGERDIAIAKIRVGEAATKSVPLVHQIHGAIGFTDEYSLHHSTRRLWSWRDEYGNETDWARELGRRAIEQSGDDYWAFITASNGLHGVSGNTV